MSPVHLHNIVQTTQAFPNMQAHKPAAVIKRRWSELAAWLLFSSSMMRCHFSHTLVDTEHLILLLVPICVSCCLFFFFFRAAVLKDLREHYFAGREDGSRLRSASGKHGNRKRPWLSRSTSFRDGSEAWAGRNYGWEGIQRTDQWDTSHRRTKLSHVFPLEGLSRGNWTAFAIRCVGQPWTFADAFSWQCL